ncbi:DUF481 domain-containing protein [Permianibacter aggregans]|uniref:Putative salt-induced outer membrane protein YdiY n=1 Tax=Permianibacter aggregans TaxID=1510150 RepID=A0A4R6UYQ9_9GAMM|nr:DUF481 domain-containing protein [Permianibacter aggregans]TDQ51229.1 putative salt-induced outer membrane protein YdiY [Permianibacter aggregans]
MVKWQHPISRCLQAAFLFGLGIGNAQAIVNIENLRAQPTRLGWSGNTDVSLEWRSGNSDRQNVRLGARLDWFDGEDNFFTVLSYDYGESLGETNTDNMVVHSRYIDAHTRVFATEYFAQVEQNEFRRLESRSLLGGGLRYSIENDEKDIKNAFAAGLFYSMERINPTASDVQRDEDGIYGNFYWVFNYKINERSSLVNTLYYQPALSGVSGFRALDLFAFNVQIDGRLSLRVSATVEHDSEPPEGVEDTDIAVLTGLSYEF